MKKPALSIIVTVILLAMISLRIGFVLNGTKHYEAAKENLRILSEMTPDEVYQMKKLQLITTIEGYEKKM